MAILARYSNVPCRISSYLLGLTRESSLSTKPKITSLFSFFLINLFILIRGFAPYIDMNQPWLYMCSPSWNPLPLPFPTHHSGTSQCTSSEYSVSCIQSGLAIYFTYGNIHVSMVFSQIIPSSPSPTESKSLFCTSVGLFLFCM